MKFTIKLKLILTLCIPLLLLGTISIFSLINTQGVVLQAEKDNVHEKLKVVVNGKLQGQVDTVTRSVTNLYENSKLENVKAQLAEEITTFNRTIKNIYFKSATEEEAKTSVFAFINEYRWGNGRYLFAYDADSVVITAHGGNARKINFNAYSVMDRQGKYYNRDIVSAAKKNEVGFTQYLYMNHKSNEVEEKITASMYFKPLNLVIATGEYISTLQQNNLDTALNVLSTAKYGKNGYFWVIDKEGTILAHPNSKLVGTKVESFSTLIASEIKDKSEIIALTEYENPATKKVENKINYARKIFPEWGWIIVTGAYESDINEIADGLTNTTRDIFQKKVGTVITISVLLLLFFGAVAIFIVNSIIKRLGLLKESIDTLSTGEADLTSRIQIVAYDELGRISESVNKFISYLQSMLIDISQASTFITDNIGQLKEQSERNNIALITHASETEQVVSAIAEMSATSETVAQGATETAANTHKANEEAKSSKSTVQEASSSVIALVDEVESASVSITTMNENTQEVINVLGVIGSIAEQTNLLALNAAIEAARAGEQGRGFAVVADEVRSLAARTQTSTAEINEILSKLRHDATTAVAAMDLTKKSCERTAENTEQVSSSLDTMSNFIVEINDLSTQIATASEEQSATSEEISRNMNNIHEMVQELTANGQQTVDSTQNLASANDQLTALVHKFKLE